MRLRHSETFESQVSSDHTSEGILLKKSNGNILHFFRYASGASGDHLGNAGDIYVREFNITTMTWGSASSFYSTSYDDRNVNGGVTDSGRMVLFIWTYDWDTDTDYGCKFLYSDNDGASWSSPASITTSFSHPVAYGNMIKVPTKGYMKGFFEEFSSKIAVQFSADGSSWGSEVVIADLSATSSKISETTFAYIGDGKIIGLVRNGDQTRKTRTYMQVTSSDYGETWSSPVATNVGDIYWVVAPVMWLHNGELIILAPDRRSVMHGSDPNLWDKEGLWIYTADPATVFADPTAYEIKDFILRPALPPTMRQYGYTCYAQITDNSYLVVWTDRFNDGTNENANHYHFYLFIPDTPEVDVRYPMPVGII